MGLSDGAFFMIKHTPLPINNYPISNPICPLGVADTFNRDSKQVLHTVKLRVLARLVLKHMQVDFFHIVAFPKIILPY